MLIAWLPSNPFLTRLVAVVAIALIVAVSASAASPKRSLPPKFGKSDAEVFFLDAREKLIGERPKANAAPPGTARDSQAAMPAAAETTHPWSQLVTAEVIEDEIKSQQMKLSETLANATKFKGGDYRQARVHLSMLATFMAIDAQFDKKLRWQREAAGLRNQLAKAGFHCKVGTDAAYKEARLRADELTNLIRGGSVPLEDATADSAWPKVADRGPLMKQLEQSQQGGLALWTANAGEFARHADRLSHDAQIVAALAEVIHAPGYEFAEDDAYREQAKAMQDAAIEVRDAAEQKDYDRARQAAGEVSKACARCHEGYRS